MHYKRLVDPVFLMCSERSGSNLIARFFGAHPDFFAPSPAHLFRIFSQLDHTKDLRQDLLRMFAAKLGIWKVDALPQAEQMALFDGCDTTAQMIAALLNKEGALRNRPRLFLKENSAHAFLPFMEEVSDNPKYVFMVRDPRDMAASWVTAPTLRGGVLRSARRWKSDVEGALKVRAEGRNVVQLTYEALVSKPEETLRRVCEALDLEFSESMLEHAKHDDSIKQDATRSALWQNVSRDIMKDNFNKFSTKLDDDQIAYIEALCGPLMAQFGYQKSRPDTAAPFGQHESFAALEAALDMREPWEKPAYKDLPQDEQDRLQTWSSLKQELDGRYGAQNPTLP
ncbi:sulfotransferase [uncultured Roseovarius sp.]|uniref:sulfotransferase family protein n=1 Tax=uncultured Roseovarius sp. TaxID=293344 RepID=UPI0026044DC2|nr:sulfotransferase [uncultured Roseovarius sp.]